MQTGFLRYKCVVLGVSAGGMNALLKILPFLPATFPLPLIVVQHLHPQQGNYHIKYYNERCKLLVKEADEKERIERGTIYFAPPNYHLLIETNRTFSLSIDEKVNYSRPSIDVLFDSAADNYRHSLIGVILTGANNDGALGLKRIKQQGGIAIVQDPATAEVASMPRAALKATEADYVVPLSDLAVLLVKLSNTKL